MNKKEIIEISNKYKVALPENSENISWKEETHFVWVKLFHGFNLCFYDEYNECFTSVTNFQCVAYASMKPTFYAALQIQDLMNLLPQNIDYDTTYSLVVSKLSVHYENSLGHTKHNFMVVSNNIVNALCELYLSLKSANVIL